MSQPLLVQPLLPSSATESGLHGQGPVGEVGALLTPQPGVPEQGDSGPGQQTTATIEPEELQSLLEWQGWTASRRYRLVHLRRRAPRPIWAVAGSALVVPDTKVVAGGAPFRCARKVTSAGILCG